MSCETVVFVCTGNTCRSPLAMALAQRHRPCGTTFHSAGLQAVAGQPATEHARAVANERGVDLDAHRSRRLDGDLVRDADWIIGMTRLHVAWINARLSGSTSVRVGLLGRPGVDLSGRSTPDDEEVADPFGASLDTYRKAADQIERLLEPWQEIFSGAGGDQGECS